MNKRILVLFASVSILVMLSVAGCGRGYSTENYLIWKIIEMPDGSRRVTFRGVADSWSIKTFREDILCFGKDCLNKYATTRDYSGMSGGLIAVQFTPTEQKGKIEAKRIGKPLFPPYMHFSLANPLGWILIHHEIARNDRSISEPTDADVLDPLDAVAYYDRGGVHAENGRYDKAISDYSKAIEMNPKFAKALYDRGVAYYKKGQHNLAISDYARAIEINPQLNDQDDLFVRLVREKWADFKESQRS
jgi:tetratricopeptide (TPR) repeat protein